LPGAWGMSPKLSRGVCSCPRVMVRMRAHMATAATKTIKTKSRSLDMTFPAAGLWLGVAVQKRAALRRAAPGVMRRRKHVPERRTVGRAAIEQHRQGDQSSPSVEGPISRRAILIPSVTYRNNTAEYSPSGTDISPFLPGNLQQRRQRRIATVRSLRLGLATLSIQRSREPSS
jgi:hypothetical protein